MTAEDGKEKRKYTRRCDLPSMLIPLKNGVGVLVSDLRPCDQQDFTVCCKAHLLIPGMRRLAQNQVLIYEKLLIEMREHARAFVSIQIVLVE